MMRLLLILGVLVSGIVNAQTPEEILRQTSDHYKKLKNFSVDLDYAIYQGASKSAHDNYQGKFIKGADNYYLLVKDMVTIKNNDVWINVRESENIFAIKNALDSPPLELEMDIISELKNIADLSMEQIDEQTWKVQLEFPDEGYMPFSTLTVLIDKEDLLYKSIELQYKSAYKISDDSPEESESARIVIEYDSYDFTSIFSDKFSTDNYLLISKNKEIQIQAAYSKFELINQYRTL